MKTTIRVAVALCILVITFSGGYYCRKACETSNLLGNAFLRNIQESTRIKHMVEFVIRGLKTGDTQLLEKLENFNSQYNASYEGQPYDELAKKYLGISD